MKNFILLFAFCFILFNSCSENEIALTLSNEELSNSELSDIIGTWIMVDYEYSGSSRTTLNNRTIVSNVTAEATNINSSVTFSQNPNQITSSGSFSLILSQTTSGETQVTTQTGLRPIEGTTWKIDEDELIATINETSTTSKILELTDSKLVLFNEVIDQKTTTSSSETKISYKAKITFQKQ